MNSDNRNWGNVIPPFGLNIAMGFIFGGVAALMPIIRDEFSLTHTEVGFYTTAVFLASFSSALFSGFIIDRLGIRRGLILGGVIMASFVGLYSLAPTYMALLILAFGAGLGQSLITPAGNKAIITFAGEKTSNTLMGFSDPGPGLAL